ncbi:TonB-dependent receptor [Sphingomonas sp. S2-65]|uniref:TonB-dependent receptor n=1 Tax=Sphingomonas sp. S2-65 TaxID=2903960 RepID=UPI001F4003AB|nr:TonB-dependent siderophore receptor [Sphingomonas sp. S2-65]UYY58567.1 TonB-dependent siderophore receptor [Sphingomonas sp. S2-65]
MITTSSRLSGWLLAATALAGSAPAWAQDAETPEEILVTAQRANQTQVEHGGRLSVLGDQAAENVPFAMKSYGEALILNQQPQTLGQVLENDPSIRTSFGYGNAAEVFIIRGFPLYSDDVGLNGLYGITPRQLVAPELYGQVQVLSGASGFLNGAAPSGTGLGGSVNLELKRAGEVPLTRVTGNYGGGAHFGGSFDVSRRFGSNGDFGVRINGAYRGGDVAVDDEFRRSAVLGVGLDWRSDRARLALDLAYQRVQVRNLRQKVRLGSLTVIPEVPAADANYFQPWSYSTLRDIFGVLHGEYDLTDNATFYATLGARDGSEDGIYDGITLTDAATGAATGSGLYVPRTDNNEAATAGIRVKLNGFGMSHQVNFGGSHSRQVNRNGYDFLNGFATNLYDTPSVAIPPSTVATWNPAGDLDNPGPVSKVRLSSLFASDTIGLFDDRVLVTGGLRLQDLRVESYATATNQLTNTYQESAVTPIAGVVVKPLAGLSLYANRMEGLQQGPTAPIDALLINSGEVFAPVKTTQYEAGAKLNLGRFNATLAVFQADRPATGTEAVEGSATLRRFVLLGKQRNRGLEFSVDGEPVKGLRVIAGASLTEAKLRDTGTVLEGNRAVGVPEYTVNANIEWDLPFVPALTLTGRVVNTGEQQVNTANTLELDGWTRFDLGARYVAIVGERPLTFRFNVDNVANKRYWASAYDPSSVTSLLQGTPRTYKASISIDL